MEIAKMDCILLILSVYYLSVIFVHMMISYKSQLSLRNFIGINSA